MTLPEPLPLVSKETQCGDTEAGEDADDEASPLLPPESASRSPSLSGSRRTSEFGAGDGKLGDGKPGDRILGDRILVDGILGDRTLGDGILGDRILGDEAPGNGTLADGVLGEEGRSTRSGSIGESEYGQYGLSGPMKDIMDGATIPTTPKYIFKAHEILLEVRLLLQECLHTDVVLVAADEEYAAHTKILKVRGGALHNMAEEAGTEGRVLLPDMSGEVLLEVLRFVYTGIAPAVDRMPRALLSAAHRAGLPELKGRCAEVLVQKLNVHNVTEIFELADKNEEERLKQASAVLFLENAKEVYDTEEWHASLDLRPAAAMRLVHIAVSKTTMDFGSMSTGTYIVHLIARIYMVAIVPVVGYILYATVRNKIRAARGLDGNSTTNASTTPAGVIADVINATVNHSVALVTGIEEDEFFASANDEL